jgi:hypothetical protein
LRNRCAPRIAPRLWICGGVRLWGCGYVVVHLSLAVPSPFI